MSFYQINGGATIEIDRYMESPFNIVGLKYHLPYRYDTRPLYGIFYVLLFSSGRSDETVFECISSQQGT